MSDPTPRPLRVLVAPGDSDGAIAAMAQLAAAGHQPIGLDAGRQPWPLRSRHARGWVQGPDLAGPDLPDPAAVASLVQAFVRSGADQLLPINTPATWAALAGTEGSALAPVCPGLPPREAFLTCLDRQRTLASCQELGLPVPLTFPGPREAAAWLRDGPGRRVVVKPALERGAGRGMSVVGHGAALEPALRRAGLQGGDGLLQEWIPGPVQSGRMVHLLFGAPGRLVAAFTSLKRCQWPPRVGSCCLSRSTAEEGLVRLLLPFFVHWRWRGPAEVDIKIDPRDGRPRVLEINPRFPGYLAFTDHCGLPMAALAVRLALDADGVAPLPFPAYRTGLTYLSPGPWLRACLHGPGAGREVGGAADLAAGAWMLRRLLADPLPVLAREWRAWRPRALAPGAGVDTLRS